MLFEKDWPLFSLNFKKSWWDPFCGLVGGVFVPWFFSGINITDFFPIKIGADWMLFDLTTTAVGSVLADEPKTLLF